MKTKLIVLLMIPALLLSACGSASPVPPAGQSSVANADIPSAVSGETKLKTAAGEMIFQSAKFVDEVNGTPSLPDCQILLVFLNKSDGSKVDLKADGAAFMGIFIHGEDGSETVSTMGGFVDGNFAIGFQIPNSVKTYTLAWGDNPKVQIIPES